MESRTPEIVRAGLVNAADSEREFFSFASHLKPQSDLPLTPDESQQRHALTANAEYITVLLIDSDGNERAPVGVWEGLAPMGKVDLS